jgi:hypothetical protein
MSVVSDIPQEFEKSLEVFRPHFAALVFEYFKRYVPALIVSENVAVEGIPRILIQAGHPRSIN